MSAVVTLRSTRSLVLATLSIACMLAFATHSACAQTGRFGVGLAPAAGGIAGWVMGEQASFYRALAG